MKNVFLLGFRYVYAIYQRETLPVTGLMRFSPPVFLTWRTTDLITGRVTALPAPAKLLLNQKLNSSATCSDKFEFHTITPIKHANVRNCRCPLVTVGRVTGKKTKHTFSSTETSRMFVHYRVHRQVSPCWQLTEDVLFAFSCRRTVTTFIIIFFKLCMLHTYSIRLKYNT